MIEQKNTITSRGTFGIKRIIRGRKIFNKIDGI